MCIHREPKYFPMNLNHCASWSQAPMLQLQWTFGVKFRLRLALALNLLRTNHPLVITQLEALTMALDGTVRGKLDAMATALNN